jgi:ABC-type cobalamin/Fe3+-siderophores transport system ATPase subunit
VITKLTLRNFKSIDEQVYDFTLFDLLVGRNNSGKSTVLQAMAIWQFCVDAFQASDRKGNKGIQVVLPNFTALPVPEFNLLWKDRTDRKYPKDDDGKRKQEFILIEIMLEWKNSANQSGAFGVELRYHSSQTMYAIPVGGWKQFRECEARGDLPRIAYVPPFSGLEPTEKFLDVSPMRQQVGKGQPGSVLRNLLLRVSKPPARDGENKTAQATHASEDWSELASMVKRWFSVEISPPRYESTKDVYITVEYKQNRQAYDVIAGGSGFHQILTLLAFLFGYRPTTLLLDEPDAHLHVHLQREVLDYFKRKSQELGIQFLIATHAEEFVRGVDVSQIVSLLHKKPTRVQSTPAVLQAMANVSNDEIMRLMASPYILYVEGESDERILRAWAGMCEAQDAIDKLCFKVMGGGSKQNMKAQADEHFAALQQIMPTIKRLMLFDFDDAANAFHPSADNTTLSEWKRKNIENYLLVPGAWTRAASKQMPLSEHNHDLFAEDSPLKLIDAYFVDQNLTLPPARTWQNVTANVFSAVDGKKLLFENPDSLFHQLREGHPPLQLKREEIALHMTSEEIHEDVHQFMSKLKQMTLLG